MTPPEHARDPRHADAEPQTGKTDSEIQKPKVAPPNSVLTQLLAPLQSRAPIDLDPGHFLEKRPDLVEGKRKDKKAPEHAIRADALSYDSQPEALREVIQRSRRESASSWFSRLSDETRSNLVYTYNRMITYGIWGHVRVITSVEAGERPVNLGPLQLHVAGESQRLLFEVYDGKALRDTVLNSGHFGKDIGPAAALHPGQSSMREWSVETVDGLHLSSGPGTKADAHIDKRSPTNRPHAQTSQFDFIRSIEHHWQELWPQFGRALPGWLVRVPQYIFEWLVDKLEFVGVGKRFREALKAIPKSLFDAAAHAVGIFDAVWAGTTMKAFDKVGDPDPSQRDPHTALVVLKEYRFGSKGRGALPPAHMPAAQATMDAELSESISRAVYAADPGVVRPSGRDTRDQGNYPDAPTVGLAIAGRILHAANAGGSMIGFDLGQLFYDLTAPEVAQVKQQLSVIGRTAREALAAALTAPDRKEDELAQAVLGVRSVNVQLGRSVVGVPLH